MKISKLFHWCYAFLMLLPICAIGVKCGYVMLNKNAYQSYTGSYAYEATTNLTKYVNNSGLSWTLISNNNYYINESKLTTAYNVPINTRNDSMFPIMFNTDEMEIYRNDELIDTISTFKSFLLFRIYGLNSGFQIYFYDFTIDSNTGLIRDTYTTSRWASFAVDGTTISPLSTYTLNDNQNYTLKFSTTSGYVQQLNSSNSRNMFTFDTYFVDGNLSSVFYSALQELDKVEFFSWAKNSFLAQPFMYIGNLFGIPNVHPIFTFLSYWCAISIIWLVFDLFMYMPLLVHKWIDKAKVE